MKNISEGLLIDAVEEMCDDFCMWPLQSLNEDTLAKHCDECPMTRLLKAMEDDDEG